MVERHGPIEQRQPERRRPWIGGWVCASVRECARVCASVRECARVCASVRECARVCACVRVCASVRVCECASVRVCVCVRVPGYSFIKRIVQITAASRWSRGMIFA